LVYGGTSEAQLLLGEDGDGEEAVVEVAVVMAILQGLHLLIAVPAMTRVPASGSEADLLHRAGDRVSGRERWVVLQRDMRWDGVPVTTIVLPLNKEDHSLADRTIMMLERVARGHARRRRSQPRQPALVLDLQDGGRGPGFANYIKCNLNLLNVMQAQFSIDICTKEMEAVGFTTIHSPLSNSL
jgi:hypothetical protein